MASERSKRRDLLALSFITKSISKKLILFAIFNVSVLGFSMYFCLKTVKTYYYYW